MINSVIMISILSIRIIEPYEITSDCLPTVSRSYQHGNVSFYLIIEIIKEDDGGLAYKILKVHDKVKTEISGLRINEGCLDQFKRLGFEPGDFLSLQWGHGKGWINCYIYKKKTKSILKVIK